MKTRSAIKLVLALAGTSIAAVAIPARAADDSAVIGGDIGETTIGILAHSSFGAGPPAPPTPLYIKVPAYAGHGLYGSRCWFVPQQVWDGYGYVVQRARFCN